MLKSLPWLHAFSSGNCPVSPLSFTIKIFLKITYALCFALFTFYPLISIHSNQALFPLCYWNCFCQGHLWTLSCQKQWLKFLSFPSAFSAAFITVDTFFLLKRFPHLASGKLLTWPFVYLSFHVLSQFSLALPPFSDQLSLHSFLGLLIESTAKKTSYPWMALKCMPLVPDSPDGYSLI